MLEKTPESPLDSKEIKPVNPKGNQPRIFTGRTDDKAEAPILWPPDAKSWLIRKDLMLGKIEGRRRRGGRRMRCWMASPTQWTWVWANSGRYWRTGKPGVLQSVGSQRVRYKWATEQQQSRNPLRLNPGNLDWLLGVQRVFFFLINLVSGPWNYIHNLLAPAFQYYP